MRLPDHILNQFFVVEPKDKVKTDGMSVIVTVRGANRIKQMTHCVQWAINQTLDPLEVIIVEDGPTSLVDQSIFAEYPEVRYAYIKNVGAFCKSACYNHGVSLAKYENITGIDADLLMHSDFLMAGYLPLQKHDACFMADDIYYLEGKMEDMFDFNFSGKTWQSTRAKWQFHGGSFFIKKQKYFDIGGHDENFKGHGSEDSEFYKRVHDLLTVQNEHHAFLHIEHDRDLKDFEYVESNKLYLYGVQSTKLPDRIRYLRENNKHLKGDQLTTSTTIIPDITPANFDARITRLQELQLERQNKNKRLIDGKPNPRDAAPIIVEDLEKRRRRVLGFR